MLENILQLIQQEGQQQVVENPAVPNEYNNAVMAEASHAVAGTLQQEISSGNIHSVNQLFGSNDEHEIMRSPVAQKSQGGFLENITSKLGLDPTMAAGLAASFIPRILGKLVHRTNSTASQDSGFDLGSLVKQFSGGQTGHGFGNVLSDLAGGSGLGSLMGGNSSVTGGEEKSGSLEGVIKGFFGNK